jgi:pyroglutamyl-peptidase
MQDYVMKRHFPLIILVLLLICAFPLGGRSTAYAQDAERPLLRVLISGFEPFGFNPTNPTGELARKYAAPTRVGNVLVKGVELPVVYYRAWEKLESEIKSFEPDYIISFGLDSTARMVRFERVARNEDRGYPDNDKQEHKGPIVEGGPAAIDTDLPVDDLVKIVGSYSIPAYISTDAGGYLCNHLFYLVMYYCSKHPAVRGGFVHMPNWPVDGASVKTQTGVLKILLETIEADYSKEEKGT